MAALLTIIGLMGGSGIALSIYGLALLMRRPKIIGGSTVLGWFCAASTLTLAVLIIARAFGEPDGMAMVWLSAGLALIVLMGVCAGVGVVQQRHYQLTWAQAFAVVMVEAAMVAGILTLLSGNTDKMIDILRFFQPDLGYTEAWQLVMGMLWKFALSLTGTLLSLEFITPFLIPSENKS